MSGGWRWFFITLQAVLIAVNFTLFLTFLLAGSPMLVVSALGTIIGIWCIRFLVTDL